MKLFAPLHSIICDAQRVNLMMPRNLGLHAQNIRSLTYGQLMLKLEMS